MSFVLLPGREHGVGHREFFICEECCVCYVHLDVLIRFYRVPTKMNRNSVCPRQVSSFCGLDKSTIPPVYLQLSTTLYRPSWAAVHNTFFLSVFSLPLYIFRWSRSVTTTVNKCSGDKLSHVGSFNTKTFFSEGQKNLVNSENVENLSNYQLLKWKPSVCSTSLHFSKLITVVQFFSA